MQRNLQCLKELDKFPHLTIFCAGSYGRLEASEFSDIDMFFFDVDETVNNENYEEGRTKEAETRLFGKIVNVVVDELRYPKFSNDGEYLNILNLHDILRHLGGRYDDSKNTFTARMLLLLESKCLVNEKVYNKAISESVNSYFIDYPAHSNNFKPIFLINDIVRYWKTLCLNYEHKRKQRDQDEQHKISQKVRNFKLKFSRMTTCFATITALACQLESITDSEVIELVNLTPRERLLKVVDIIPEAKSRVDKVMSQYEWFLKQTGLPKEELHALFSNKNDRKKMFDEANDYGDRMFEILKIADGKYNIFRYLVI